MAGRERGRERGGGGREKEAAHNSLRWLFPAMRLGGLLPIDTHPYAPILIYHIYGIATVGNMGGALRSLTRCVPH